MRDSGAGQIGFIAQEVQSLIPELVSGVEGDLEQGELLGLNYGNMSAVLVKAMQELAEENRSLIKRINQLESLLSAEACRQGKE